MTDHRTAGSLTLEITARRCIAGTGPLSDTGCPARSATAAARSTTAGTPNLRTLPVDRVAIMRMKIITAVGAVCLLATGCGSGGGSDADAKPELVGQLLPQKLTKPVGGPNLEPTASPAADAAFAENVAYELQRKTLAMANAPGAVTGKCPKGMGSKPGTTATCTITYEGVEVAWQVTIGEKGWSENVVEYQAFPRQGLLTREGVARIMFGNDSTLDYALCDDIPKAVLVPFGKTKYKCEKVSKGEEPIGYNQTVNITDTGPRVY